MNEAELKELCREWQSFLGLAHWRIDVLFVRGVEIENNRAQIDYNYTGESALIRIRDPVDHHGYFPFDAEQSLVHELLHVVFDIPAELAGKDIGLPLEQRIDRLARVLVKLRSLNGEGMSFLNEGS